MSFQLPLTDEDLQFLREQDRRLHYIKEGRYCGEKVHVDLYHDQNTLSLEDVERIKHLTLDKGLILTPENTNFGFSVGFAVVMPSQAKHIPSEVVLRFKEKQLPRGYSFQTLAPVFMNPSNTSRAILNGLPEIVDSRDHYDY